MTTLAPLAGRLACDRLLLLFHSPDASTALERIVQVLRSEGYQRENSWPGSQVYGRGSKTGRFLAGGLSSRQEFQVSTQPDGELTLITVQGTATVVTAGALGISKARKELARLSGLIMGHLGPCPDPKEVRPALGRFASIMTQRPAGRAGEYAMVIILMLIVALVAGLFAVWAVVGR